MQDHWDVLQFGMICSLHFPIILSISCLWLMTNTSFGMRSRLASAPSSASKYPYSHRLTNPRTQTHTRGPWLWVRWHHHQSYLWHSFPSIATMVTSLRRRTPTPYYHIGIMTAQLNCKQGPRCRLLHLHDVGTQASWLVFLSPGEPGQRFHTTIYLSQPCSFC